ncbi:hypothetical protein Lal_00008522 [Lupinus albus]|nr:hypothetical protein Lal_00008522 [Lupinus albus]
MSILDALQRMKINLITHLRSQCLKNKKYIKRSSKLKKIGLGYSDIGDPVIECDHCGACMWY